MSGIFERVTHAFTGGQRGALLQKLCIAAGGEEFAEERFRAVLRGELAITLVDAVVKLVDKTGRCIPLTTMKGEYVDANRDFHLVQPEVDYTAILAPLRQHFASEMNFVSAEEFEKQAEVLIAQIRNNKQVAHLLKGVYLPIVIPQCTVVDYGRTLEDTFLTAVECAHKAQYPDRVFHNYRKDNLAGKIDVVEESRHQRLIEKMSEGPVVLIHFPNPMQGFSISADNKMIDEFPTGFVLSGVLDTATSLVAYPATLARDWNTPGLDCAANRWRPTEFSLCFGAYDDKLRFDVRSLRVGGNCSGGLSFVG